MDKLIDLPPIIDLIEPLPPEELRRQQFDQDGIPNWLRQQIIIDPLAGAVLADVLGKRPK